METSYRLSGQFSVVVLLTFSFRTRTPDGHQRMVLIIGHFYVECQEKERLQVERKTWVITPSITLNLYMGRCSR